AHVWFFKSAPSKLSLLLDISPRALEEVIYFAQYLVTHVDEEKRKVVLNRLNDLGKERMDEVDARVKADRERMQNNTAKKMKKLKIELLAPKHKTWQLLN